MHEPDLSSEVDLPENSPDLMILSERFDREIETDRRRRSWRRPNNVRTPIFRQVRRRQALSCAAVRSRRSSAPLASYARRSPGTEPAGFPTSDQRRGPLTVSSSSTRNPE